MRKRTLGVVLLAGLAMSGAGAFTGSNSFTNASDTNRVAGYGAVKATGVTVTKTVYDFNDVDSKMDKIVFTASGKNLTGLTSRVTLTNATAPDSVVRQLECTEAPVLPIDLNGEWTVTCDFFADAGGSQALTTFDTIGLAVFTPNPA